MLRRAKIVIWENYASFTQPPVYVCANNVVNNKMCECLESNNFSHIKHTHVSCRWPIVREKS